MYIANPQRNGKRHFLGRFKTKRERNEAIAEFDRQRKRGFDPTAKRTVRHAIARYREECLPSLREHGRAGLLDWWERSSIAGIEIAKLHRGDIADELRSVKSNYRHNRKHSAISAVCREAVGWGWREDNPARGIKRRKESTRGAGNPFTREELDRVLWAAADDENRYFRALPVFLADTGCRLGEALKLQWSDVELGAGTVTFRDTKNGRDHVMPLTQRTVEALREVGSIRVLGDDRLGLPPE